MLWAVMGIGMLINTIQGAKMRGQASRRGAAVQQQMNQLKAEMGRTSETLKDGAEVFKPRSISRGPDFSIHVDYPEKAHKNLNKLQNQNLQERMGLEKKIRKDFGKMKDQFFKENHYETQFGGKGKGKVVTDRSGRPKVKPGPETTDHKTVRQHFESTQRLQLANKHGAQMDSLTQQEAAKAKAFLTDNSALLADAGVQQELQKLVVTSKKKALKLQQTQDEERWKADMPPTAEIQSAVENGLQDLRAMEARHVEMEETSPDHQIILDFEKQFAAQMADERARAAAQRDEDKFLMDPRKMMARAKSGPPEQRFDQVLPGYLTASLFQMGVYEV